MTGRPVGYLLGQLRRRPGALALLAAASVAEAAPALACGYATARAIDDGFAAHRPGTGLAWLGLLALAAVVGAAGARAGYRCLGLLVEPVRDDLARRVVAAGLYRSTQDGGRPDTAAVSRLTHQVEIVRDTFAGMLTVLRGFLFSSAAALVGLVSLAPALAVLVLAPLAAGLALFFAGIPAMVRRQGRYVRSDEHLARAASDVLAGHRDVAACGAAHRAARLVPVDEQARAELAVARVGALRGLSLAVGGWLPVVTVLAAAPTLTHQGVRAGAVLGALVYVTQALQPALHTLVEGVAGGGLRLTVTLARILDTSAPPPPPDPTPPPAIRGSDLALRGVTFRYGPHAAPVLDGFDLDVPDGTHLAVVGASGIGKSTLAALMAGVRRPQSGSVRLGGAPAHRVPAARRVLIPQEAYVFTGTVAENLAYLGADQRELDAAVDALGARGLVDRLGGYGAPLDPRALSAGERQLLALVRAYAAPARLVILDEASCHLDPAAEARVERAFADRPGALVVIAHRISSARRAGTVLLLDGPRTARGTHEELVHRCPTYRELVGFWGSDPAGLPGDVHGLDAGTGAGLGDDAGQVVAYRPGR